MVQMPGLFIALSGTQTIRDPSTIDCGSSVALPAGPVNVTNAESVAMSPAREISRNASSPWLKDDGATPSVCAVAADASAQKATRTNPDRTPPGTVPDSLLPVFL